MKKILLIGLIIIATCMSIMGCHPRNAESGGTHQNKLHSRAWGDATVYTDPDTRVQYIVFSKRDNYSLGVGITPRLNPDGTPMINK